MSDSSLLPFNPAFPLLMTVLHRKGLCCHSIIWREGLSPSRLLSYQGSQPCPTHVC
ncbi:unknown protein [Microcystis aeruginosa NIES-843]|uniref:Uncharacterized protein n=1 Tax=Microcystis aeruginosa (strain NIES-843 / IAM M-2473) TaxID=449447 RepID=B0JVW0_MICAN|nr:unknown protein [Microcystis aeruginosa NIES-843]